jgi:hypothetical protein
LAFAGVNHFLKKISKPNNRAGCFFGNEKLGAHKLYNSLLLPADPLREALCEHQEESAVIDTPLQKGARGWSLVSRCFLDFGLEKAEAVVRF